MLLYGPVAAIERSNSVLNGPDDSKVKIKASLTFSKVGDDWYEAVTSDSPDDAIRRYFRQEALALNNLEDQHEQCQPGITIIRELTALLVKRYGHYLDNDLKAPRAYLSSVLLQLSPSVEKVLDQLRSATIPLGVRDGINRYYAEFRDLPTCLTYAHVDYYKKLTLALIGWSETSEADDDHLRSILFDLDFNDLEVFRWLTGFILSKAKSIGDDPVKRRQYLLEQKYNYNKSPEKACYHDWPPLSRMISEWIKEELDLLTIPPQEFREPKVKLQINLPVSQLASLLKMLYDAGFFPAATFSDVLRFFSKHCSTKRQSAISYGSMSKESYVTNQFTASRIRHFLSQLITDLNRRYFP